MREAEKIQRVVSLESRRGTASPRVHGEKVITGQLVPFPTQRLNQSRPIIRGDTASRFPLLGPRTRHIKIGSHFRERVPGVKNIVKRSEHGAEYAPDELSVQGPTMNPMTGTWAIRTICPMGRGVTPTRVRSEIATRLKAARIHARFTTQKEAADALGIRVDRYEKWESGRTPVPAQYVGPVCQLYGIDANYLFGIEPSPAARKTA